MCAPCCNLRQGPMHELRFQAGPVPQPFAQGHRLRFEKLRMRLCHHAPLCHQAYQIFHVSKDISWRCRHCRGDRVFTAACQHKTHHVLSRRSVQAELLAALLLTVPSTASSAETESTSSASRAAENDELDLTVTEKVQCQLYSACHAVNCKSPAISLPPCWTLVATACRYS